MNLNNTQINDSVHEIQCDVTQSLLNASLARVLKFTITFLTLTLRSLPQMLAMIHFTYTHFTDFTDL